MKHKRRKYLIRLQARMQDLSFKIIQCLQIINKLMINSGIINRRIKPCIKISFQHIYGIWNDQLYRLKIKEVNLINQKTSYLKFKLRMHFLKQSSYLLKNRTRIYNKFKNKQRVRLQLMVVQCNEEKEEKKRQLQIQYMRLNIFKR
ncbi:unnamed protein product [Paramecium sonneborni]|uniref:Uncharacterized protein n=1 Tax=Paramecium sonneborni TaxID=65129 RepID=A0A8S1QU02_9CILI|nr:unnamed protein product [Paramecium sonneborni]